LPRFADKRNAPPAVQRLIDLVNSISPQLERHRITSYPAIQALLKQLKSAKQFGEFRRLTGLKKPADLLGQYFELHNTRDFLRWIAHLKRGTDRKFPFQATHSVSITGDGKLHFIPQWPELEGGEATRIRQCSARIRLQPKDAAAAADHSTGPSSDAGHTKWLKWHCGRLFWVKMLGKRTMTGCCPAHTAIIKMNRLRADGYPW
jgi:hypothetical protein